MNYGLAMFPGQGAQHPGMGVDLAERSAAAKRIFDAAGEAAGFDVLAACRDSSPEELSRTELSQIAIFTHSLAALAAMEERGVTFSAAAGFSLGEYTALTASGVLSLADGLRLVRRRGQLMQAAADAQDGCMAAVLGLDDAAVEEACRNAGGVVLPVNYNCPGQLVVAGERAAVEAASEACKAAGARRVMPLAVSGAFHTPMMGEAAEALCAFAGELEFHQPKMPVYTNLTGGRLEVQGMPAHLRQHMVSPVRWCTLMQNAVRDGYASGCELGPGKTLCGFARKIDKGFHAVQAETFTQVEAASEEKA